MANPRRYMPSEWKRFGEMLLDLLGDMPAELKSGPRLTALVLAGFEARYGEAYPTIATIARHTGGSPRTVGDHLNVLHRAEVVATYPSLGESSSYAVDLPLCRHLHIVPSAETAPPAETADDQKPPDQRSERETAKAAAPPLAPGVGQGTTPVEGCAPLRDLLGDFGEDEEPFDEHDKSLRRDVEATSRPAVDEQLELAPVPSDARSRPSPARREASATTSRPHDLALCGPVPPTLSDELKAALLRLPGGTGGYVMLAKKHLTAEEAEYVVRRALVFAERRERENDPIRDVRGIVYKALGDVFERRTEARERREAARHDAPFDPESGRTPAPRPRPGPRKTEPPKALEKPIEERDAPLTARVQAIELSLKFTPNWDGAEAERAALERELVALRAQLTNNKESAA